MRTVLYHSLLLGLTLAVSGPVRAERHIPYADMHQVFERIERLQGGQYLRADVVWSSTDPAVRTEDIHLVIRSRQGDIPVPVSAAGQARFPVRADLLAENPPVVTNLGPGKLSMRVSLVVEAPPQQRFRYSLLVAMLEEADRMIAKQGLMARMVLPDFEDFTIVFAPGSTATATVEAAAGAVVLRPGAEGRLVIPDRRDWRREDPWIQLSALPQQIMLGVD